VLSSGMVNGRLGDVSDIDSDADSDDDGPPPLESVTDSDDDGPPPLLPASPE
jgi:hypothetical protein